MCIRRAAPRNASGTSPKACPQSRDGISTPPAAPIPLVRRPGADYLADAIDNQTLGRDMGRALSKFPQETESDLWEVVFRFV